MLEQREIGIARFGARYAMPAIEAIESSARALLDAEIAQETPSKPPTPPVQVQKRAGDADREQQRKPARTDEHDALPSAPDAGAEALPPATLRKPTPPPFDPLSAKAVGEGVERADKGASKRTGGRPKRSAKPSSGSAVVPSVVAPAAINEPPADPDAALGTTPGRKPPTANLPSSALPPSDSAATMTPHAETAVDSGETPQWHEEIFDDSWMTLEPASAGFHARQDVRFLLKHCGVPRAGRILDVACGIGRHAMEMAAAGYQVVGIDRSRPYLKRAVDDANRSNLKIRFVEGDVRSFSFPPAFDAVTCFHTSFGYFSDRENLKALRCMAASLNESGQLILDVINRDWVASIGARRLWWEHRGFLVMEDVIFREREGLLEVERTVIGDTIERWDQRFEVRLYTASEYAKMFREVGLELVDITGNLAHPGVYLGAGNHRMILRARKRCA